MPKSLSLSSILLWLLAMTASVVAQDDHIETDRDSFTRSPRVVAPGFTVLEGSYTFLDQRGGADGQIYPDFLARFGTTDWLELRIGWTYEDGKFYQLSEPDAEPEQLGIINYGTKLFMTAADGAIPDSSLIVTGYTRTNGDPSDTDFALEYALGWEWGEGYEFDVGMRWFDLSEEEDHFNEWAPSAVFKVPVFCRRLNAHVEYFSLSSTQRDNDYVQQYIGPGIHYLLTQDIEVGTRVFWGMSDDSADFIANVGMGWRF